ncbi:MAG: hypothetical protein JJ863_26700 [Deltaproteobacteria bacterium]|nr:hypothetical protein [Deltaproteobacteria bacterium]
MRTHPAPSDELDWLRDAWRRLTHTLPTPADVGLRAAASFVDGVVPRGREEAAVVWLLGWRMMPRPKNPPFGCDFWVHAACSEVYCYFDGRGYGDRRVLQLYERWARWLHATGELSRESTDDLLGDIDHHRLGGGFPLKRPPRPRPFSPISIEHEARRLFPDPGEARWAAVALHATLAFLDEVQRRPGRLHALDPEAFALDLRAMLEGVDDPNPNAPSQILATTATLYRELAGSAPLPADVATTLADRLERLALGCRPRT